MKLRKGDEVKIVLGKDKGKVGKIEKVYPQEQKVLIGGVNQYKRHLKSKTQGQKSEIITLTKPLNVAAVSLICPKCHKITRVGFSAKGGSISGRKIGEEKARLCRKCGKLI